jgi:hypothetical protein
MAVLVETEGVGSAASKRFALANVASVAIKMEMFFMGESELAVGIMQPDTELPC